MSSKTSVESPEFFVDRSLGKQTAQELRAKGWALTLLADVYPADAQKVKDEDWIAYGCRKGWSLLTKDAHIRYRAKEIAALSPKSLLFCLSRQDLKIAEMVVAFEIARPTIERAIRNGRAGFYHVSKAGQVRRMPTT